MTATLLESIPVQLRLTKSQRVTRTFKQGTSHALTLKSPLLVTSTQLPQHHPRQLARHDGHPIHRTLQAQAPVRGHLPSGGLRPLLPFADPGSSYIGIIADILPTNCSVGGRAVQRHQVQTNGQGDTPADIMAPGKTRVA